MKELVVVAIGGNSIIKDNASQSIEHQAEAVKAVADTVSVAATDKVAATANVASMTAAGMSMTTPTANAVA